MVTHIPLAELFKKIMRNDNQSSNSKNKKLSEFKMEEDDSPILIELYRWVNPRRFLEIGTWKGFGSRLVLQSTQATVWSLNLLEGERDPRGRSLYEEESGRKVSVLDRLFGKSAKTVRATDSGLEVGSLVHEAGLGHRFNQIFCDSRLWDTTNYPPGFFDAILIDGSHQPEVVVADTKKTTPLLRSGGVMIWHDYCPVPEVIGSMSSVRGVTQGIEQLGEKFLEDNFSECFWIDPSWLLVGIKK
jgi:predicted O-methyltransferase YrrM